MATIVTRAGKGSPLTNNEVDQNFINLNTDKLEGTVAIASGGTGQTTKTAAFDALSPATTKGDLIAFDGTDNVRLGVGTNDFVLTADSTTATGLAWKAAAGGVTTFSGGTTGLTPSTATSGAVTLAGTLALANGGTGATDAATARSNLGLAIGTNVQAYDADLAAIAGLTPTADNFIVGNGTTWILETPAQARTSLGATTVGSNLFTLTNPGAIRFPRFNADNTVSALTAADFRTAIGAGTSSTTGTVTSITAGTGLSGGTITSSGTIALANTAVTAGSYTNATITVDAQGRITSASSGSGGTGTVTSVSGSGTVNGISLSGTVTTSGSLTLSGSVNIDGTSPNNLQPGNTWLVGYAERVINYGDWSGPLTVNMMSSNWVRLTATGAISFNLVTSGVGGAQQQDIWMLEINNGGAHTITWPTTTIWAGGTPPTLTASGKDLIAFTKWGGNSTWLAFVVGKDIK